MKPLKNLQQMGHTTITKMSGRCKLGVPIIIIIIKDFLVGGVLSSPVAMTLV